MGGRTFKGCRRFYMALSDDDQFAPGIDGGSPDCPADCKADRPTKIFVDNYERVRINFPHDQAGRHTQTDRRRA